MARQRKPTDERSGSSAAVTVRLTSPQLEHLKQLSQWDDKSLSRCLGEIIERQGGGIRYFPRRPPKNVPVNFVINLPHLVVLDRLAIFWGITRSEVARRLIDSALASNEPV